MMRRPFSLHHYSGAPFRRRRRWQSAGYGLSCILDANERASLFWARGYAVNVSWASGARYGTKCDTSRLWTIPGRGSRRGGWVSIFYPVCVWGFLSPGRAASELAPSKAYARFSRVRGGLLVSIAFYVDSNVVKKFCLCLQALIGSSFRISDRIFLYKFLRSASVFFLSIEDSPVDWTRLCGMKLDFALSNSIILEERTSNKSP